MEGRREVRLRLAGLQGVCGHRTSANDVCMPDCVVEQRVQVNQLPHAVQYCTFQLVNLSLLPARGPYLQLIVVPVESSGCMGKTVGAGVHCSVWHARPSPPRA